MIVDWLLAPLIAAVQWAVDRLPDGHALDLPDLDALWDQVRGLDSLVPVLGVVQVMLGLLAFAAVFVVVRLVLTVWNLIYP